ncbi:MAG: protein-tyrosine-phosphatase [Bacteroidota bacterium]
MVKQAPSLYPDIQAFVASLSSSFEEISSERRALLHQLATYISQQERTGMPTDMIFICTHNSRRSHFGQIWAKVLANSYGFDKVQTYSGGTESTAFHPHAIRALRGQGFQIEGDLQQENPHYQVQYGTNIPPIEAWSKVYSDPTNPQQGFCAIMTCDEANEACPIVFGAAHRIPLTYVDPKVSDGTPQQAEIYTARSRQIATEMAFVFAQVTQNL